MDLKALGDKVALQKDEMEQNLTEMPFVTHLQISDFFQEFLCAPDQNKLVGFENQRL